MLELEAGVWYVNVGESRKRNTDGSNRSWEDNREYGFISAGRQQKATRQIRNLGIGDRIYAYLSEFGYVGYGELLSDIVPTNQLQLPDGRRLSELPLRERGILGYSDDGADEAKEWAAAVKWTSAYDRSEAKTFKGIFSWAGAACKLTNSDTLEFLAREFGAPLPERIEPQVWVEKTGGSGRSERLSGDEIFGQALWSPKTSKNGADIYRFMRDVAVGDIILHLTENQKFSGVSQVASTVEEVSGVSEIDGAGEPCYRIQLSNYRPLEPQLTRETFLGSNSYRERLLQLIKSGEKHLFYNEVGALRQGAYLTPAPPALIRILNDAYASVSGQPILSRFSSSTEKASNNAAAFNDLVAATHWPESSLSTIVEAIRHPVRPARQIILAGPPGTGKTYVAQQLVRYLTDGEKNRSHIVQFHPSYTYEQFVEGLRPTAVDGAIQFKPEPGIVLELAEKCRASNYDHFLIVDEFNRANLPRVLGELMFLFEYRDKEIDLPFTRNFSLPPNLFFIATMNTADRNIRSIDVALRRRFQVFECPPDPDLLDRFYAEGGQNATDVVALSDGLRRLNECLSQDLDEHHTVGHAFFMSRHFSIDDLTATWNRQLKPLIAEYFFASPEMARSYALERFWPGAV